MDNDIIKLREKDKRVGELLNFVVFPCVFGAPVLLSERPQLEGVNAVMCAKEMDELLQNEILKLTIGKRPPFDKHQVGKEIVKSWAHSKGLEFEEEIDVSIGVVDVLVYADDVGIFEIGTTKPSKMLLLLRLVASRREPFSVHFWPYGSNLGFAFQNWF